MTAITLRVPFEHQLALAESVAKSRLFGIQTSDQALALMALCEAEGLHPATAMRDYHIIQGKPALKADAMMARFQAAGGRVKWLDMTDERVSAEFSHPSGGTVMIDWDKARATVAGFWGKDNWKKFPRAMLRARVVSEGIRTVFPGCVVGVYTPEEVQDFEPARGAARAEATVIDASTGEIAPKALPSLPDDRFAKQLPAWRERVAQGSNPADLLSMLSSKYTLSAEQVEAINGLTEAA